MAERTTLRVAAIVAHVRRSLALSTFLSASRRPLSSFVFEPPASLDVFKSRCVDNTFHAVVALVAAVYGSQNKHIVWGKVSARVLSAEPCSLRFSAFPVMRLIAKSRLRGQTVNKIIKIKLNKRLCTCSPCYFLLRLGNGPVSH